MWLRSRRFSVVVVDDSDCDHGIQYGVSMGLCTICSGKDRLTSRLMDGGIASVEFNHGTVELECPYNEDFVAELKVALPVHARAWVNRRWVIASEFWDQAEEIVLRYFTLVE